MSDTGYKPSAGEHHAQQFAAKRLMEAMTDGHGTPVSMDWNRLGRSVDFGVANRDSSGEVGAMTTDRQWAVAWKRAAKRNRAEADRMLAIFYGEQE